MTIVLFREKRPENVSRCDRNFGARRDSSSYDVLGGGSPFSLRIFFRKVFVG